MKRIGLLGGSFDPPHKGHLFISLEAIKIFKLNEVWWLVTPKNYLKIFKPAPYKDRMLNCNKVVKNHPIKIKEYEKKINSNYTYLTIKYLNNKYKFINFLWLMGADNLIHFHKWQKWRKIFNEVPIVVFKRYGYNNEALNSIAKKTYNNYEISQNEFNLNKLNKTPSWIFLNNKEVKVSSTDIRSQRKILENNN